MLLLNQINVFDFSIKVVLALVALYSFIQIYARNKNSPSKLKEYIIKIFLIIFFWPISELFDDFLYGDVYNIRYGYLVIVVLTAFFNIYLLYFSIDVFMKSQERDEKKIKLQKEIFIILQVAIASALIVVRLIPALAGLDTLMITLFMLISVILYFYLIGNSVKLIRVLKEENQFKKVLKYIVLFNMSLIGIYIFFIIDSFYIYYTIYATMSWSVFLLATIFAKIGFIPKKQ
ncbi:MAG: hypothetical protein ACTSU2_06810 [Promethearchaeota archaeon]